MWLFGMTRQEYKDFLLEHAEQIIDRLMQTDSFTLDSIVTDELRDELEEYLENERYYWEAC